MAVRYLLSVLIQKNLLLLIFCSGIDASAMAQFNTTCEPGVVQPTDPLLFTCEVNGVVLLQVKLPSGDQETISVGDDTADVDLPTGFTPVSLSIKEVDESRRNFSLTLSIDHAYLLEGSEITCDDSTPKNRVKAKCPIGILAEAKFTNESCANDGVNKSDLLHFTCKIYAATLLRVKLPTGEQEIISAGDKAADVKLPAGFTVISLHIEEIDDSRRNFHLTLSIESALILEGGYIACDDSTPMRVAKDVCPIGGLTTAKFENDSCNTGVKESDPLLFTCKIYATVSLRVLLPTGDQEIISIGDTTANIDLPTGFTAVSLDITEIDESRRNIHLTLSIDNASRLKRGNITCDNTSSSKSAEAGCPLEPLYLKFINDTPNVSEYNMRADFKANRKDVDITCTIPALENHVPTDCSSGTFSYNFTSDEIDKQNAKKFFLHVTAVDQNTKKSDTTESVTLKGAFRVFGLQDGYWCSLNMINTRTSPLLKGESLEFIRVGNANEFTCKIDNGTMQPCGEPAFEVERNIYNIKLPTNLTSGDHRLLVKPTAGCKVAHCYKNMVYMFVVAD